jgi:hypothetical protein
MVEQREEREVFFFGGGVLWFFFLSSYLSSVRFYLFILPFHSAGEPFLASPLLIIFFFPLHFFKITYKAVLLFF